MVSIAWGPSLYLPYKIAGLRALVLKELGGFPKLGIPASGGYLERGLQRFGVYCGPRNYFVGNYQFQFEFRVNVRSET